MINLPTTTVMSFFLGAHNSFMYCSGEGAVQKGMGHVPDKDGGCGKSILQDDGHHPSKLHKCLVAAVLIILLPLRTCALWNDDGDLLMRRIINLI